jgi:hypothetical protein
LRMAQFARKMYCVIDNEWRRGKVRKSVIGKEMTGSGHVGMKKGSVSRTVIEEERKRGRVERKGRKKKRHV